MKPPTIDAGSMRNEKANCYKKDLYFLMHQAPRFSRDEQVNHLNK